jgi:hypothetical protein
LKSERSEQPGEKENKNKNKNKNGTAYSMYPNAIGAEQKHVRTRVDT